MFAKLTCVFPQLLDLYKKERLVILTTNGCSTRGPTAARAPVDTSFQMSGLDIFRK